MRAVSLGALELRPDLPVRHEEATIGWLARAAAAAGRDDEARQLLDRRRPVEPDPIQGVHPVQLLAHRRSPARSGHHRDRHAVPDPFRSMLFESSSTEETTSSISRTGTTSSKPSKTPPTERSSTDSVAGSFGHCKPAGEELIADNVARAVNEALGRPAPAPDPAARSSSPKP